MNTPHAPAEGLPELPPCFTFDGENMVRLYTDDQMRAYGEQCRREAPRAAGGDGASPDGNVEAVRAMLLERSQTGLRKYGITTERNDLTISQWLRHLQEELLDAAVYVQALTKQTPSPSEPAQGEDLPGMWDRSDFTGGDPDERSYSERTQPPAQGDVEAVADYDWDAAHGALESMDDYARMDKGVAPYGPYAVLRDLLTKAKGWKEAATLLRQLGKGGVA